MGPETGLSGKKVTRYINVGPTAPKLKGPGRRKSHTALQPGEEKRVLVLQKES